MLYDEKRLVIDESTAVFLRDKRGQKDDGRLVSTTCTLEDKEMAKVRHGFHRRLDFVFRHGARIKVDLDIATALLNKFDFLYITDGAGNEIDINDDVSQMDYKVLMQTIRRYNEKAKERGIELCPPVGLKRQLAEAHIRRFRRLGLKLDEETDEA